ncbi:hypothetical protein ACF0H5_013075 [Mactra antiquata]
MFESSNYKIGGTLRDLCLQNISKNTSLLVCDDLKALPHEILNDLKWYLCAYDLLRYETVFNELGIELRQVWEKQLHHRYKIDFICHVFTQRCIVDVVDNCDTAQTLYMKLHSSQMLYPILLPTEDRTHDHDECFKDFLFFLKFTPYLVMLITKHFNINDDRTQSVLQTIGIYVKHIELRQRGTLDVSKYMLQLVKYFNSDSNVKSFGFQLKKSCKLMLDRRCDVLSMIENTGKCLLQLFPVDGLQQLSIVLDRHLETSPSIYQLTHLHVSGPEVEAKVTNDLMIALNDVYRDPSKQPMKVLEISTCSIDIVLEHKRISEMNYAVEELSLSYCDFQNRHSKIALLIFIRRNQCLQKLELMETNISDTSLCDYWDDIWSHSELESLTIDIEVHLQNNLHSLIQNSRNLTFLYIQWHTDCNRSLVKEGLSSLKNLRHLKTLVNRCCLFGEIFTEMLLSVYVNGEYPALRRLDIRRGHVTGSEIIKVGESIWKSRGKYGRKLQVLDLSMNIFNRKQQREIYGLYNDLTDILLIDIADPSHAFSDV